MKKPIRFANLGNKYIFYFRENVAGMDMDEVIRVYLNKPKKIKNTRSTVLYVMAHNSYGEKVISVNRVNDVKQTWELMNYWDRQFIYWWRVFH